MNIPEKFFNEMKKKKVAFIGIGVSNKDVIKMFAEKGIVPTERTPPPPLFRNFLPPREKPCTRAETSAAPFCQ